MVKLYGFLLYALHIVAHPRHPYTTDSLHCEQSVPQLLFYDRTFFSVSDLIYRYLFYATMAEKAEFDCAPYVPKENALTDSEIDALKSYPDPPEDVDVSTKARVDVDGDVTYRGYIYVFREEKNGKATGLYKVGRSGNPPVRRNNLQSGNYRYLHITKTYLVDDMVGAEAAAHRALRRLGYHVQLPGGGTEWYGVNRNQEIKFYDDLAQAITG